jgi:hypothetical protein
MLSSMARGAKGYQVFFRVDAAAASVLLVMDL